MAGTSTAPAPARGQAQQVAPRPFITGSMEIESHVYDVTTALATSPQTLAPYDLVTDGYVSGIYISVVGTTAGNAATTAFGANGPWGVLGTVQFSDVSNRPILGPMNGWELKEAIKYGGYSFAGDPQDSVTYSAAAGAGATGGSFAFILHLPIEFVHRNALGSLTNLSNAAVFRLELTLAGSGSVYTTAPTSQPSVRVRVQQHGWMESAGHDARGRASAPTPLAVDSVQFWEKQTYTVNAGSQNFRFTPFEGSVRTALFILTDGSGSRVTGEADWPDPFRLRYDAMVPVDRMKSIWQRIVEEDYGYRAPLDTAGGRESGVYPLSWATDFGLQVGAEQAYAYLSVSSGTSMRFDGTIGGAGAHTLTILWNYINPVGGNDLSLTGGK